MRTRRQAVALALVAVLVGGCVAAAVPISRRLNLYETEYGYPYEQVYTATLATLTGMDASVENAVEGAGGAEIVAKEADGRKIAVNLDATEPEATRARIQVGTLGDKEAAEAIGTDISRRLAEGPQPAAGRGGM